jgi:transcription initiation factor TFIID subunit 5
MLCSVTCMDFSKDHQLVAVGTMDSYIRVWSMDGKPLKSRMQGEKDVKINNRKLIGHSGPVYDICFSDAISNVDRNILSDDGEQDKVDTSSKMLLSCSADGHVRLWSLDVWQCLCIYKGHDGPITRLQWGPHGHYFATGGWDKTVRVWMQDKASAQRLMVGHETSISAIAWHPNGAYIFSASDETDKTVRMWSVVTGRCVRIFTGHTDYVSCLEVAPNGRLLASADAGGNIFFWDVEKGSRIKRSRGHGKGGVWSMSFSAESTVLVSGGQDGTVRIWDIELPAQDAGLLGKGAGAGAGAAGGAAGQLPAPQDGAGAAAGASGAGAVDGALLGPTSNMSINVATGGVGAGAPGASSGAAGSAATGAGGAATGAAGGTAAAAQGAAAAGGIPGAGTGKKKGKEVMITPDQISAFPTKKTPVMKVQFTRMNLVVAGGCFDPER